MKPEIVSGMRVDVAVLDTLRHLDDDHPMTLKQACELEFGGAIKPASLMAEHRRGNLRLEKVGRTYLVTRGYLKEMRNKCLVDPPQRALGSGSSPSARMGMEVSRPHGGSSVTATSSAALDWLKANVAGLKRR